MYSVDWNTKIVTIPKADLTVVSLSPEVYSLDVTDLWQNLIDLQDDTDGMTYLDIVLNTPPLVAAGVTFARVLQIINGYTITFQDGQYAVNIIGGNSNISDVVNKNMVSVNTANSAGLIVTGAGGGDPWTTVLPGTYPPGTAGNALGNLPAAVAAIDSDVAAVANDLNDVATMVDDISTTLSTTPDTVLDTPVESGVTLRQAMRVMMAVLAGKVTGGSGPTTVFRDVNDTKDRVTSTVDSSGNRSSVIIDPT
jgi:hypothetical protein